MMALNIFRAKLFSLVFFFFFSLSLQIFFAHQVWNEPTFQGSFGSTFCGQFQILRTVAWMPALLRPLLLCCWISDPFSLKCDNLPSPSLNLAIFKFDARYLWSSNFLQHHHNEDPIWLTSLIWITEVAVSVTVYSIYILSQFMWMIWGIWPCQIIG